VPLAQPFDKGHGYDPTEEELAELRRRLQRGQGLYLVAEAGGRIVALLEVEPQEWNHTAWVWDILVDWNYRRRGVGRSLMQRAIAWAKERDYRALSLETQSNNINACRFYQRMGFRLTGIREDLYTNEDIAKGEVAIFWSYPLRRQALHPQYFLPLRRAILDQRLDQMKELRQGLCFALLL